MSYPNDPSNNAASTPVRITGNASTSVTGVSTSGTVGTAGTDVVLAAGTFKGSGTIENTHATQTLYLSFNTPATVNDIKVAPGSTITIPFGPTNALYGIGSGTGTTFAAVGY